jgi:hypothetical protein
MVMPVYPHCAFQAEDAMDMGTMCDYTFFTNALEWPSASMPVTTVQDHE